MTDEEKLREYDNLVQRINELERRVNDLTESLTSVTDERDRLQEQNERLMTSMTNSQTEVDQETVNDVTVNEEGSRETSMAKDTVNRLRRLNVGKNIFKRIGDKISKRLKEASVTSADLKENDNSDNVYDVNQVENKENFNLPVRLDDQVRELTETIENNIDELNENDFEHTDKENNVAKEVKGTTPFPWYAYNKDGSLKFNGTSLNDIQKMGLVTKGLAKMALAFPILNLATTYVAVGLMKANSFFWNHSDSVGAKNFFHSISQSLNNFLGQPFEFDKATGKWFSTNNDFINQTKGFFNKLHMIASNAAVGALSGFGIVKGFKAIKNKMSNFFKGKKEVTEEKTSNTSNKEKPWDVQNTPNEPQENIDVVEPDVIQLGPSSDAELVEPENEVNEIQDVEPIEPQNKINEIQDVIQLGPPTLEAGNVNEEGPESEKVEVDNQAPEITFEPTNIQDPILIYPESVKSNIKIADQEKQKIMKDEVEKSINDSLTEIEKIDYQKMDQDLYAMENRINEIDKKNYKTDREREEMDNLMNEFNQADHSREQKVNDDKLRFIYNELETLGKKETKTSQDKERMIQLEQALNNIDNIDYKYQNSISNEMDQTDVSKGGKAK